MSLSTGDRVQALDGEKATVRYIGEVDGQKDTWVGVEWDADGRGKHDGSLEGRRYFECSPPGRVGGSFLRPHKIAPRLSLLQALKAKYSPEDGADDSTGVPVPEGEVVNKVDFQLVGTDKIRSQLRALDTLQKVYLPDAGVTTAGSEGEIRGAAGSIEELDLTGNLLRGWQDIEAIGRELSELQMLTLSRMPLDAPTPGPAIPPSAMPSLRVLVLNSCGMLWETVVAIAGRLPALEEVHACGNGMADLALGAVPTADAAAALAGVRTLNLDGNALSDWGGVGSALGGLPGLQSLSMNDNALTSVSFPGGESFASLRTLLLGRNQLSRWEDVDQLAEFRGLADARVTDNPLTKANPSHSRFEVIARVKGLERLNGSPVTSQERRESEVRYLRVVATNAAAETGAGAKSAPAVEDLPAGVADRHPRYAELLGKYGEIGLGGQPGGGGAGSGTLGDEMLSLTLTCVAASAGSGPGSVVKKLPGSLAAGKLKLLCEKLFKLTSVQITVRAPYPSPPLCKKLFKLTSSVEIALFARGPESPVPEPLGDDAYELSYLGVMDGWEILVDEAAPGEGEA